MSIANLSDGNQAVVTTEPLADEPYKKQLGDLAVQWRNARATDLEIRHRTGALLNQRYGNPDTRLARGREIMLDVATQLQVAQSELSRMRRLAFHFESIEDLKKKHSEVTSWTAVKGLLPKLKPQGKPKAKAANGAAAPPKPKGQNAKKLKKIKQLLEFIPVVFGEVQQDLLTDDDRKDLRAKFDVVATVFGDCLKASLLPDTLRSEDVTPLAQTAV